jgi:hypothetical protein
MIYVFIGKTFKSCREESKNYTIMFDSKKNDYLRLELTYNKKNEPFLGGTMCRKDLIELSNFILEVLSKE